MQSSAFSISQQIIDEVLTSGGNELDSTLRIAAYFKKDHSTAENTDFLQKEYRRFGNNGKGFIFGGTHVSVWFDEQGIRIASGDTALNADNSTLVTWEQAARRIRELLDMGRFMPQSELNKVDGNETKRLADELWYTHQDRATGYEFSFMDADLFRHGFPDSTARIAELIAQPEQRQNILNGLREFAVAYEQNHELLRFRFSVEHMRSVLNGLADLEREPLVFATADESVSTARPGFITQDEVDKALAGGSSVEDGHYRIYSYFLQDHTAKEKADFLKHEYGTGGGGRLGYDEWHDGKGIAFSRENNHMPYDKVILPWPKVAKRIDELIAAGRYMSQRQLDYLPEYEKGELAREIYFFYENKPADVPHPYPMELHFYDAVKTIRPQLDELERVAEILSMMAAVLDNTADFDRRYESMRKAFNDLTAYQNGTFSLFTPANKSTEVTQARKPAPKRMAAPAPSASPAPSARAADESVQYDLQLGAAVYIGMDEYEIYSFDDAHVVLRDMSAPLFTKDMPRAEFDRKLRENRLNDGLIKAVPGQEAPPAESPPKQTVRDIFDEYAPLFVSKILFDQPYLNARKNSDEQNARIECEYAIGRIAREIGMSNMDFLRAYSDEPWFKPELVSFVFQKTYTDLIHAPEQKTPPAETVESPRVLYKKYLPKLVEEIRQSGIYPYLRDRDTTAGEAKDEIEYWLNEIDDTGKHPGLLEALDFPQFQEWLIEDILDRTYQDVATDGRDSVTRSKANAPDWAKLPELSEQIREDLSLRGFVVSDELIAEGIEEHRAHGGRGNFDDVADFIENEYLTEEPAPEPEQRTPKAGERYEIDGRLFVVEYVDVDYDKVSLRDITFEGNTGFPIFRSESLDFMRMYQPINIHRALAEDENPSLETNQEIRKIGGTRYIVVSSEQTLEEKQPKEEISGLKSIVIDFRQSAREVEPVVNYPVEIVVVKDYIPRYTVKPLTRVAHITSDPPSFYDPQNTTAYGVYDNQDDGRYLKNDDGTYLSFDAYGEAEAHAAQLNAAAAELTPAWEKPKPRSRTQTFDPHPEIPMSERHNFVINNNALGHGGAKTKYRNNVEAIKTLQTVEAENRFATPEEQEILSQYVGWGSLADAFDENKPTWAKEYAELKALLSPEDYVSARATTLYAHYTSPTVIKAIYKAVENMGFKTGNILDPGCGIGNFQGLLPDSMSGSKVFGVELDSLTGRIARQLYQKNSIAIQGFENTQLPDSFFDLAIGNVPFGDFGVLDKRYDKHKFHIHDYFFAKTLDKVRPGGVIAFVTSKWMMDKKNPTIRKYIAQRADLLGAIRLPCNAFMANAGTEVTTDIIFLQKRDRMTDIEPDWVHLGETEDGIPVNSYFAEHPDMMLGTMSNDSGVRMYGAANSTSCVPFPDADLSEQLADAIINIHAEISEYERGEDEPEEDNSIPADPNVRNFSYTLVDGKVYYRQDSRMVPVELPVTTQNRVKGMIKLRECVRDLIMYQTEGYPDSDVRAEQAKLNRLYDDFTRKYGLINSRGNSIAFSQDSAYCLLCSLEIIDENGELERKADMFQKRTIKPHEPVTHVDTASEALSVSMSEKARVDLAYMSELTGMSEDALIKELEGVIFLNVGSAASQDKAYVTADEYLSGNVRDKLAQAKAAQATLNDGSVDANVKALEAALPQDLSAGEISVRLGATWLPEDVVQQFMYELLQPPYYARDRIKVHYLHLMGSWSITEKNADRSNVHVFNTYGTQRMNAYKIIEETLNLRDVRVFDYVEDADGKKKAVLNKKETAIAQAKQEIIRTKFEEWVWKDPARRESLCRIYNDKFNSIRPREYDGSHLRFPGMNPEITLRKHQIDAIAHVLYGGNTLLAHEVGAGKTFEMVAAAMESKRLGLCNKSLFVVPNHITEQWAAEFLQLYPSANILVATKKDFETKNRKKFCARIATGDYDAVIIGHSQFEKIPMSVERQQAMLERQIDELIIGIAEVKENKGEKFTIKQMEKSRKNLELRLAKITGQTRKDDVVTFEELGVDRLFIDEAHYYKNLFLVTKMRNVAGIAQTEAQKSSDLFMKCQYLDELTDSHGTVFATGTPVSNSMVELYTMQRYLQYKALVRNDLQHFDAWASTFGETVTAIELAPEGTGYRAKMRFARFYNLPELMSMFRMVADIQTADMLDLPVPKANFHTEVIKPSEWQKKMVADLAERAAAIRGGDVDPTVDNMRELHVTATKHEENVTKAVTA